MTWGNRYGGCGRSGTGDGEEHQCIRPGYSENIPMEKKIVRLVVEPQIATIL